MSTRSGLAIEWHDFRIQHSFNWGRTFHPNSLEFCLNLKAREQSAERLARAAIIFRAIPVITLSPMNRSPASRRAHDHHQFVTLEFSREHLQKQFARNEADLEPEIRRSIFGEKARTSSRPRVR